MMASMNSFVGTLWSRLSTAPFELLDSSLAGVYRMSYVGHAFDSARRLQKQMASGAHSSISILAPRRCQAYPWRGSKFGAKGGKRIPAVRYRYCAHLSWRKCQLHRRGT